ncbi:hypothetical protein [uncultured Cohaesibacter sp.]|uniref:hypothetical protein n=1 Tax=uncultured Cohaesibacter sp. TaxID=1002546 RepID=UPI0029C9A6C4|nr:hypothetical protein [uncultured Cohaesibacter sp.]
MSQDVAQDKNCKRWNAGVIMALFAMLLQFYLSSASLAGNISLSAASDDRATGWVICTGLSHYPYDITDKTYNNSSRFNACIVYRGGFAEEAAAFVSYARDFQVTELCAKLIPVAAASSRVCGKKTGVGSSRSPPLV